jgi:hypothetical protein
MPQDCAALYRRFETLASFIEWKDSKAYKAAFPDKKLSARQVFARVKDETAWSSRRAEALDIKEEKEDNTERKASRSHCLQPEPCLSDNSIIEATAQRVVSLVKTSPIIEATAQRVLSLVQASLRGQHALSSAVNDADFDAPHSEQLETLKADRDYWKKHYLQSDELLAKRGAELDHLLDVKLEHNALQRQHAEQQRELVVARRRIADMNQEIELLRTELRDIAHQNVRLSQPIEAAKRAERKNAANIIDDTPVS